jgi:glycosyltransferase involved in cell wall biosynthesis
VRIAYVCADAGVPVFGRKGASVHVVEVLRALVRLGASPVLVAARVEGPTPSGLEDMPAHELPLRRAVDRADRERAALELNGRVVNALDRVGRFDAVYERYSLWSYGPMEYARRTGIPGLLEVNAPLVDEQADRRGLDDRATAERVAERAFAAATCLLAVSNEVASYLGRDLRGRVQVLPNAVAPERFVPRAHDAADKFTVGFVATLKPWHGLETLVDAFALLRRDDPATRLLIVGDGPGRDALEADLAARGLADATTLTGAVDPDAVPSLLASMDVAVAPYPPLEPFYFSPLKVYEYLAAGVPVVASRIGQLAELIVDGETGLLTPPGDAVALADALARLRASPHLGRRLARAGRALVLRDHTWDARARRILELANGDRETKVA